MVNQMHYLSPVDTLCIQEENEKIIGLFPKESDTTFTDANSNRIVHENAVESETPLLHKTHLQLEEYFAGKRTTFNLPIEMRGTMSSVQTVLS